ncbi:hypothetical protein C0583_02845 [Candidatus Parcubacteria bacterium]|nr:MAG: hypothetical protein C0583_02845 [Candidatus Parcubacteria bacterium]
MENEAIILNVPNKELGFFKASLGSIDLKRTDYSVFYKNMGDYSQVSIFSRHPSIQLELQNEIFLNGAFKSWYDLRENES